MAFVPRSIMSTRIALALALVLAFPLTALADDGPGAIRLGGGIGLFDYAATDSFGDGPIFSPDVTTLHTQTSSWDTGLSQPTLSLDLAVVAMSWLAIGMLGSVGYGEHDQPIGSGTMTSHTSALTYEDLAYVEASFREEFVRPFLRVAGGVMGSETTAQAPIFSPLGITSTSTSTSLVEGVVAVHVGTHFFAVDDFSVSPYVGFAYASGTGTSGNIPIARDSYTLSIGVELLGWIATSN